MIVKACSNRSCVQVNPQPLSAFNADRSRKTGVSSACKSCESIRARENRRKRPEQYRSYMREYVRGYRARNPDKIRQINRKYNANHPEVIRRHCSMRDKRVRRATPKWLTSTQREAIRSMYLLRPSGYHVDHILPLKGRDVCGLHVPWNLQYLPASQNLSKSNSVIFRG